MGGGAAVVWYGNRQVDLAAQALKIDPESKEQMLKVFDNIDVDKSGQLSKEELKLALDKAGMHPTQFQLDAFFKVADEDNSGEISREEWMDALTHHHDNKSKHGKDLVKGAMPNNRRQNKTLKERGLDKVTPPKPQA